VGHTTQPLRPVLPWPDADHKPRILSRKYLIGTRIGPVHRVTVRQQLNAARATTMSVRMLMPRRPTAVVVAPVVSPTDEVDAANGVDDEPSTVRRTDHPVTRVSQGSQRESVSSVLDDDIVVD